MCTLHPAPAPACSRPSACPIPPPLKTRGWWRSPFQSSSSGRAVSPHSWGRGKRGGGWRRERGVSRRLVETKAGKPGWEGTTAGPKLGSGRGSPEEPIGEFPGMKGEAARRPGAPWWQCCNGSHPVSDPRLWPPGWSFLDVWTEWRAQPCAGPRQGPH